MSDLGSAVCLVAMKAILKRLVPIAFYLAIAVFLAIYLTSIDYTRFAELDPDWRYLLVALTTGITFRYWGAFVWTTVLRGLGAHTAHYSRELVHVYAKSWMGRYIPGTAPWIMGKIYFASKHGISKSKLAVSSLLEGGLQIIVLLVISAVMLAADPRLDVVAPSVKTAMILVVIVGILCLIPAVFNRLVGFAYQRVRRQRLPHEHHATTSVVLKGAAMYAVGALISGLSLFFVAKTVDPTLGYAELLFIMGAGNLAGAVSMLAVFTPSGLGVREAIQLILLSLVMPTEFAILVTVLTRLMGVGMDAGFLGLTTLVKRLGKGHSRGERENDS
jgi:uncharacterized membrane protein YbhN (UPF0104 family)